MLRSMTEMALSASLGFYTGRTLMPLSYMNQMGYIQGVIDCPALVPACCRCSENAPRKNALQEGARRIFRIFLTAFDRFAGDSGQEFKPRSIASPRRDG
jgi:hypothetical protein